MKVVFAGLSITSSWGNGHATNYRALVRELARRGHEVLFCERDVPWYSAHRDLAVLPAGELCLYADIDDLRARAEAAVAAADLVVLGSFVPQGTAVARWLLDTAGGEVAFYDIDTPITLAKLDSGDSEYLTPELVPRFDLYLSFTAGPTLDVLRERHGARRPVAFHCLVDPTAYRPQPVPQRYDLGYLGTYSEDRQPGLDALLMAPGRRRPQLRLAVAGSSYPDDIPWPDNVERIEHLAPAAHPAFYCAQRFTLNITRAAMRAAGWSPSVRLFEAAACGVPIISDDWPGLESVLKPGAEVLVAGCTEEVLDLLHDVDQERRLQIAAAARRRVLSEHTAAHRVALLEDEVARHQATAVLG